MYDKTLFQERMADLGLHPYSLSQLAGITNKTAKKIVETGTGQPNKIYKVAKVLGFPVRKNGKKYDFTSILKKRKTA